MKLCRIFLFGGVLASCYLLGYLAYLFPWPAFLIAAGITAVQIKRHGKALWAYGTAVWASVIDIERAGMFGGNGLGIGKVVTRRPPFWRSLRELFIWSLPHAAVCERFVMSMRKLQPQSNPQMVRLNHAVHSAIFAPTGAGKGVSLVVPFLLECPDSCVVIDPKGENAKLTAEARRKLGHKVVILDPFKVVGGTDTFNPLSMIDASSSQALDDCRAIAKELVVRTGAEPDQHWNDSAENVLACLVAASLFMEEGHRSLQTVRMLLSNAAARDKMLAAMVKEPDWGGMLARLASLVSNLKDKELSGVISTANRHTAFLDTVPVAGNTSSSSFDPAELRKGKVTVYLVLPPEYLRSQSALMRLWIGSTLRACVKAGPNERNKVHFVLDEAASLGRLEVLDDAVDKYRGYGVRLMFFYQSIGQLKKCWGNDGGDQTLLSNTTQLFFAVNDQQTAEYVSNRLGEKTIVVESGGTSEGGSSQHDKRTGDGSTSRSWNTNHNWSQLARRLLKPEEVTALDRRIAITFTPGLPPLATALTRYYEDAPGNGWWRAWRIRVEVWLAAISLLALTVTVGAWLTVNFNPLWSQSWE